MANKGVPKGGSYPSRGETAALMKHFTGDASQLFMDRRTTPGKMAGRVYSDQTTEGDQERGLQDSGQFYSPRSYDRSQMYTQGQADEYGTQSAFTRNVVQWDIPTSSTNYKRPRTVAAGYSPDPNYPESDKGVLTVVFRDGTFYNYYEITHGEWSNFHSSFSKGRPWLNKKNKSQSGDGLFVNKPRGDAGDMEDIDPQIRAALYRVARTNQIMPFRQPKVGRTSQTATLYQGKTPSSTMEVKNRVRSDKPRTSAKKSAVRPSAKGNRKAS
jgi:hypothetical protein